MLMPFARPVVERRAPVADPYAFPVAGKVTCAITGASMVEIAGAMVPFPDQMPEMFAEAVLDFLARAYPAH
jgi:hypothetical protein